MTELSHCNRGILLGATIRTVRFCMLKPGHRGQHETVYLGKLVRFDAPQKVTVEDGQS